MTRRLFRKITPSDDKLKRNRALRLFGTLVLRRRFWQLNRHSAAFGIASGLFWAWIAVPVQTLGAVAMAIGGRGNVPLAAAATWVSNPVTWVPCFYLAYLLGRWMTGAPPIDIRAEIDEVMSAGLVAGVPRTFTFLTQNLYRLYPMFIGGVVLGTANAVLAYLAVQAVWRWNVVRRWRIRHAQVQERLATRLAALTHVDDPVASGVSRRPPTTPHVPPLPRLSRLSRGFGQRSRTPQG